MSKWKLKGCPRCGGAVAVERDSRGAYENCINCGWERDNRTWPSGGSGQVYPMSQQRATATRERW